MDFLLIAVMSLQEGLSNSKAGYQTSVMERFETLAQCEFAAKKLIEVHKEASFRAQYFQKSIKCFDIKDGTEKSF